MEEVERFRHGWTDRRPLPRKKSLAMQRFPALFVLATLTLAGVSALTEPPRWSGTGTLISSGQSTGPAEHRSARLGLPTETSTGDPVIARDGTLADTEPRTTRTSRDLRLASARPKPGLPSGPETLGPQSAKRTGESIALNPPRIRASAGRITESFESVAGRAGEQTVASEPGVAAIAGVLALPSVAESFPPSTSSPSSLAASSLAASASPVPAYTLAEVRAAAYAFSPEGNLLEGEAQAVACNVDPDDEQSRCSAALISSVLREVAIGRRADDAALAAKAYHRLVAAEAGWLVAQEALLVQDQLIELAEQAERLELPDGDVRELQQQRLQLQDTAEQQRFARLKLRQELARLTGWPESEVAVAVLVDSLPEAGSPIDAAEAVAAASAQRHDLQAVANLCQGMNRCSLPAARQLLGALSPGVGLSLGTVARSRLLACLHDDRSDNDLAARRRQCRQLYTALDRTIRNETLQAVLDVRLAQARFELVTQQIELVRTRLEETKAQIQLDQAQPGSDHLVELQLQSLLGTRLERQLDLAVALDEFDRVRSMPVPAASR